MVPFGKLNLLNASTIRSGDYLAIARLDGLDPMIMCVWRLPGARHGLVLILTCGFLSPVHAMCEVHAPPPLLSLFLPLFHAPVHPGLELGVARATVRWRCGRAPSCTWWSRRTPIPSAPRIGLPHTASSAHRTFVLHQASSCVAKVGPHFVVS